MTLPNPAFKLLSFHKASLEDMIETNARACVEKVTRIILDGLDERARKFLRIIAEAEKRISEGFVRGALIMFNIYGGAPAIHDIINQAERHRALGALRRVAACGR